MTAEKIKQFMKEHRIYQWEVAEQIGITEFTLTRWLRSELKPEHEKKIIEAINCLMGEEVLKYKEPNSIVEPTKEVNAEPPADFSDLFKDLLEDFN